MKPLEVFWLAMLIASVIWFSTVTLYVAIRGAGDIKHMLARLKQSQADSQSSDE